MYLLSCLYFFLPAYFCNMAPPLSKKAGILRFLAKPIDSGRTIRGKPIFGSHKTWRGVLSGIFIGAAVAFLQFYLYHFPFFKKLSLINYQAINILNFGFLICSGAVLGDLLFAFVKRRLGLKPGKAFLPFDQTNYVIGAFVVSQPFLKLPFLVWITIFVSTFFLHIIVNRLGYHLGLHKAKW